MDDFSDATNRNIILFVVFCYYMFIKYKRTQIMIKKNIKGIKCNPLQMVVGSMFEGSSTNNQFSDCLEYAASEKLIENQNNIVENQRKEYKDLLIDIQKSINDEKSQTASDREQLFAMVNNKINNVNDLVEQQKTINKQITDAETPINEITSKISSLSDKFKDVFSSFKESKLVKEMGLS